MSAIKYRVSIIKACVMLGHILMLVTIIPEEESLMHNGGFTHIKKMLVIISYINDRLDYLSLYAHQSMEPHQ
jgi:REP element-mobilizing transposase RayT